MKNLLTILILLMLFSCGNKKDRIVGIQPLGEFNQSLVDTIQKAIKMVYGLEVKVLPMKTMPKSAFVNIKSPRYRADSIIRILKRERPDSISYVLGLTGKDISTTKRDNQGNIKKPERKYADFGIFGLGYRPGPSCIVSIYRLKSENESRFIDRLKKICVHELGHNLGLKHCKVGDRCVMRDAAETIKTIDHVDLKLCDHCKAIIEQ